MGKTKREQVVGLTRIYYFFEGQKKNVSVNKRQIKIIKILISKEKNERNTLQF